MTLSVSTTRSREAATRSLDGSSVSAWNTPEKARNRRDTAYAARLCTRAVDRLFGASGAKGIFDDNVAQRKFRDLRAANVHIAVNWDLAGTTYGRVALGLDPITPLI